MKLFSVLLILFCLKGHVLAFYGDLQKSIIVPPINYAASAAIGNLIYIFGGRIVDDTGNPDAYNVNITTLSFSSNGELQVNIISPRRQVTCDSCKGYALPGDQTLVAINADYPEYNTTRNRTIYPSGLALFSIANNSWSLPQSSQNVIRTLPATRFGFATAISPNKDAIYMLGGDELILDNYIQATSIFRFDLRNMSIVTNMTAINHNSRLGIIGSCADMLSNGIVVIAFGYDKSVNQSYPTDQVILYDTNLNQIRMQNITGTPPPERVFASSVLGPDGSTIYYYGGIDYRAFGNQYAGQPPNGLMALDTTTWTWLNVPTVGPIPLPFAYGTMVLLNSSEIVIATGSAGISYAETIGVLISLPQPGESIQSRVLRWFTNNPEYDSIGIAYGHHEMSTAAIVGITVAAAMTIILLFTLLWKYVPPIKRATRFIHYEIIWKPSPLVIQHTNLVTDAVLAPDVRFCFDGFDTTDPNMGVICRFRNGTECSQYIQPLNMSLHTPIYTDYFGSVACFLFLPGPSFYIIDDKFGYLDSTGTKITFSFMAQPTENITMGVIYVDMFAPGYDPNTYAYNLINDTIVNHLEPSELRKWMAAEQSFDLVENSFIIKQSITSTASYTITQTKMLRPYDGWNYIGFSPTYDETLTISSRYKDAPQNPNNIIPGMPVAQLTIQPSSFTINIDTEQKVFTLLNAFAQAGGVLGLFIALQTILFGFRPQSPWGIVHRWSFGRLRTKLTDKLANYFDRMGTPVPLVNPVNKFTLNAFGRTDFNPYNKDIALEEQADETTSYENRVQQVEERLQLMELLLKSYYLNDEVFRSLDQAVKRSHEERRRSHLGRIQSDNSAVNQDLHAGIKRRPSSTLLERKSSYQPQISESIPQHNSYDDDEHDFILRK
ncbi:hypothetical protein CU098_005786 [Rhizopus stolonifer]|uniref:Uncharacterized protein n=1 Tax=Rhizopus stolonifer TaxID=4846 RepID=A0A367KS09_RHIST|nr:hypothetical protein CU098_005786 [Rhizopus stolonifer]